MKLLKTIIATATLSFAFSASAATSEKEVRFVGETEFAGFCKAIINDDMKTFRSNLFRNIGRIGDSQRQVLRLVTSETGLTCNGSNLIQFSAERGADTVYEFLTSRS